MSNSFEHEFGGEKDFWSGRDGPEISNLELAKRPSEIIRYYMKRLCKDNNYGLDAARRAISERTGLPLERIKSFESFVMPTSIELAKLTKGLEWSILFIFGVSRNAYCSAEQIFFHDLGIKDPTLREKESFRKLYQEFLLIKAKVR